MAKKIIIVEGDHNDGDYVTNIERISEKQLSVLKPILAKMKKSKDVDWSSNWKDKYPNLTEEELEIFDSYVPYADNADIHTIVSVRILEVTSDKNMI